MTITVDTILYLSLYYLVSDLVHLPNPTIKFLLPLSGIVDIFD